ncbi:hypothetical protein B0H16DRAFT_758463 [Mycena metata]|uniref:RRM domain-containing protein n=1 Tax=Mycena metata TaxID=1033252 RepID=A0AAD7DYN3_9AGAR|nr:hypothetical protein B0H16DRAFT_758463 [Mycena metata]
MTEEALRNKLGRFGLINQVKIVRDKNIGFFEYQCCCEDCQHPPQGPCLGWPRMCRRRASWASTRWRAWTMGMMGMAGMRIGGWG